MGGGEQPRGVAVLATLFDENYRLYPIFNIVEALGYVRTALNAYQRQHMVSDVEQKAKLAAMGHKVVASKLNKLYVAGKDYPVLHEYLLHYADLLEEILDGCSVEIFRAHLPEHPDKERHINAAMDGTLRARAAMGDLRKRQRVSLGLSASPYPDHVPKCVQKPAEAEE